MRTGNGRAAPAPSAEPFVRWDRSHRSLLLHATTGAWVVVAGVGADIIELCDGVRSPDDIALAVGQTYAVAPGTASEDVMRYLAELRTAGFFREPDERASVSLEGLALHVTGRCSLCCRHCYASPADPAAEPPLELLVSAVRQARELGAGSLKLTGGDPLMRPQALAALADPAAGCEVTVLTNGLADCGDLAALITERDWQLQVSLDGANPETHERYRGPGTYARVTANLQGLARRGLSGSVTLSVCLSRINRAEMEGIVRQALEWGIPRVHVTRISKHGRALEHWDELGMTPKEWVETYRELADVHRRHRDRLRLTGVVADYVQGCLARPESRGCRPGQRVMVDLDGGVYPCIMLGTPEMRLGYLQEESLAACLARVAEVQQRCQRRLTDEAVCGACEWRMVCQGACPGWPLVQDGTLLRTDELCGLRRELFVHSAFEFARRREEEAAR